MQSVMAVWKVETSRQPNKNVLVLLPKFKVIFQGLIGKSQILERDAHFWLAQFKFNNLC